MADQERTLLSSKDIQERWIDIGGGCYARVVAVEGSTGASGIVPQATTVLGTSIVLSTTPGLLHSLGCLPAADGYAMVFDADTLPVDGTVEPVWVGRVYGDAGGTWDWGTPLEVENGCVVAFSTTGPFTLTAANAYLTAQFAPTT